ncbi:MAG: hypothetical protein U1A27_12575 [Phycisphaerae bacterium]
MNRPAARVAAEQAAELFRQAARLNREDPLRHNAVLCFPDFGQLVMTGDMHGHRANFDKLQRFARLEVSPARHVILHELIHPDVPFGQLDPSHELLLDAARYKCDFPDQVHFLQSNHELSQLMGHAILKNGRAVVDDFRRGVLNAYGPAGDAVYEAILDFIASYPVAARTAQRLWLSHSLPAVDDLPEFNPAALDRPLTRSDFEHGGAVYQIVWGRRFSPDHLAVLSATLNVELFIVGHIPQESGYDVRFDRVLILASDHNHGVFLPIDLASRASMDTLTGRIQKFVAVP